LAAAIAAIAFVEDAGPAHRFVVALAEAVDVHREREVRRWCEEVQLLLEQERIGAQVHVALARHQCRDYLIDLLVHQRLSAGDRDHGGLAFLDGVDALLHREPALQDGVLVLDLAAPRAREVALVEGLELEDEREFLVAPQPLSGHIRSNPHRLSQWHRHGLLLCPALAYIWATSTRSVARSASAGSPPASARVGKT